MPGVGARSRGVAARCPGDRLVREPLVWRHRLGCERAVGCQVVVWDVEVDGASKVQQTQSADDVLGCQTKAHPYASRRAGEAVSGGPTHQVVEVVGCGAKIGVAILCRSTMVVTVSGVGVRLRGDIQRSAHRVPPFV